MQPFTADLAATQLTPQKAALELDGHSYLAQWDGEEGWVLDRGPTSTQRWPITHVMGGKNVFFFLTPRERGRLQVLPVAYDVGQRRWYDATGSMVRHARNASDEPLHWTDSLLTFNTSCHGCHVSQLAANYDDRTDSYHTTWVEPGINCETCHGPSSEHVRAARAAGPGGHLADLHLISAKAMSVDQLNSSCSACHAKLSPISPGFRVGDTYFDHFDLTTLEDTDFYPDGRDLGENYTLTGWLMSPCVRAGKLSCIHCHTSSGRYRFADHARANDACLPCHAERVRSAAAHSHHPEGSPGNKCVACHMPRTAFARMRRTDHSMRPPAPAATLALGSPNACNLCHADRDASWAERAVRTWHMADREKAILSQGRLVQAARARDWAKLPALLAYLQRDDHDTVVATSLVRLLDACPDQRKTPVLTHLLRVDSSPLVRSAAATGLSGDLTDETVRALVAATGDPVRLVRVRAAASLAGLSPDALGDQDGRRVAKALAELEAGLASRKDNWTNLYNIGNLRAARGDAAGAIASYEAAIRLRPDAVLPLVNLAMAYAQQGKPDAARQALEQAVKAAPTNAVARFNLGLLDAEQGDPKGAERNLRAALAADPTMAAAAYNLAALVASGQPQESLDLLRQASRLEPDEPRYSYALAFHLARSGQAAEAVRLLRDLVARHPELGDSYLLLAHLLEQSGDQRSAQAVYAQGAAEPRLPPTARQALAAHLARP